GLALGVYSMPTNPAFLHLVRHGYGMTGGIAWPIGGAAGLARSMAERYKALGGALHLGRRVTEILTRDGKAIGIRLADGEVVEADVVLSNADGRATVLELLGGKFVDDKVRAYCERSPASDETNWAVHVFLGVNRDLSKEPSALVMLLDRPVEIAGHLCKSLEMQTYGMDPTMAPPGKGVIKVELFSRWSLWEELSKDPARYQEEKERVADDVLGLLERRWPGLRRDVEVVDVPTLITWKRFMGGDRGFVNMPTKTPSFFGSLIAGRLDSRLPGLANLHLAGSWATSGGALFLNALSGRTVIRDVCSADRRRFVPARA
ncbi:MAG: FAD-dependent oxidoreductase, partial [Candidatus Bipolaricaulis sp.]|nr:FAD-dependent oxidoreductase [Candidatus Bipolaricaulis sp.]